jgi:N-acetylglucosaminyldiphosphoundecaprenol N-acetyl-beta-D-mannosaminyltransferase
MFKLFGLGISCEEKQDLLKYIELHIDNNNHPYVVYTPNASILWQSIKNEILYKSLSDASLLIPDGFGVILASKLLKGCLKEKIAGIDMMTSICNMAKEKKYSVYLLGATEPVIQKTFAKLRENGLNVVGYRNGYFSDSEDSAIIKNINKANVDILFVAMGCPKQEIWVHDHKNELNVKLIMTVGGSFDVISGYIPRAPSFLRKLGLEWIFRISLQPFKRYRHLGYVAGFLYKIIQFKLRRGA